MAALFAVTRARKHGDHDQSDHGNWANNVDRILAEDAERAKSDPWTGSVISRSDAYTALENYTGNSAIHINRFLRDGTASESGDRHDSLTKENLQKDIDGIDALFFRARPLEEPMTVYRGISSRIAPQLLESMTEGGVFTDEAYTSTSTSSAVAYGFTDFGENQKYMMKITVPAGSSVVPIELSSEHEILLNRGSSFRVDAIRDEGDTKMIDATLLEGVESKKSLKHGDHDQSDHGNWAHMTPYERTQASLEHQQGMRLEQITQTHLAPHPLTAPQEDAVLTWVETAGAHRRMSSLFRQYGSDPTQWEEKIKAAGLYPTSAEMQSASNAQLIRDAIASSPGLPKDTTLWRGWANAPEFKVGQEIVSDGFTSTSTDKSVAGAFGGGGTVFEMKVPAGTRALGLDEVLNPGEAEILLDAGTRWRVSNVATVPEVPVNPFIDNTQGEPNKETKIVTLELMPDNTKSLKHADHDQSDHGNWAHEGSSVPKLPDPRSAEPATHYDVKPGGVIQVRFTSSQRDAIGTTTIGDPYYRYHTGADERYRTELADAIDKMYAGENLQIPSWAAAEQVINTLISQAESRSQDGQSGASHLSAARRIMTAARDAGMDVKETYLGVTIRPKADKTLKHGDHDQLDHGNWARGEYTIGGGFQAPDMQTRERVREQYPGTTTTAPPERPNSESWLERKDTLTDYTYGKTVDGEPIHAALNDELRSGRTLAQAAESVYAGMDDDNNAASRWRDLDRDIRNSLMLEDTTLYRASSPIVDVDELKPGSTSINLYGMDITPGAVISDRGYVSTASVPGPHLDYFKSDWGDLSGLEDWQAPASVTWRIKTPAGAPALDLVSVGHQGEFAEHEVLLPRNTHMVIDAVDIKTLGGGADTTGVITIDATVLPDHDTASKSVKHEAGPDHDQADHGNWAHGNRLGEYATERNRQIGEKQFEQRWAEGVSNNESTEDRLKATGLTQAQAGAVLSYSGTLFSGMNDILRNGVDEYTQGQRALYGGMMPLLDSAIAQHTTSEDMTVFRGTSFEGKNPLQGLTVGGVYTDHGYGSTSTDRGLAQSFGNGFISGGRGDVVYWEIDVPKGSNAFEVDTLKTIRNEGEVLLPRNTHYRIDAIQTQPGTEGDTYDSLTKIKATLVTEPSSKSVKHLAGEHDQDDHGNWATGGAPTYQPGKWTFLDKAATTAYRDKLIAAVHKSSGLSFDDLHEMTQTWSPGKVLAVNGNVIVNMPWEKGQFADQTMYGNGPSPDALLESRISAIESALATLPDGIVGNNDFPIEISERLMTTEGMLGGTGILFSGNTPISGLGGVVMAVDQRLYPAGAEGVAAREFTVTPGWWSAPDMNVRDAVLLHETGHIAAYYGSQKEGLGYDTNTYAVDRMEEYRDFVRSYGGDAAALGSAPASVEGEFAISGYAATSPAEAYAEHYLAHQAGTGNEYTEWLAEREGWKKP